MAEGVEAGAGFAGFGAWAGGTGAGFDGWVSIVVLLIKEKARLAAQRGLGEGARPFSDSIYTGGPCGRRGKWGVSR